MEKLVAKTAVKTVLIIIGIFAVVFAIFNFAFPQHMATLTEGMGNYALSVKYASLRYYYTKDCEDLARVFDDSVLLGEDKYVLQYGEELTSHRDYEEVCRKRNEQYGGTFDYNYRVNSKMAISLYNTGKIVEGIELASSVNGERSFAYGNPLMSLAALIKSNGDSVAAGYLLPKLEKIRSNFEATPPEDEKELRYIQEMTSSIKNVAVGG